MSVSRSQRVKNMFSAPKTANSPAGNPDAPANIPPKEDVLTDPIVPIDLIEDNKSLPVLDNLPNETLEKPLHDQKTESEIVVDKPSPLIPENRIIKKEKVSETAKIKDSKGYIGFRVSSEMKDDLEEMAKDFAYLARKEYGLKIKDDSSSILRAFLFLGMSCFTEKVRHKTLQEYDKESTIQDEVSQQLLAIMRIHNVEIDDIDF